MPHVGNRKKNNFLCMDNIIMSQSSAHRHVGLQVFEQNRWEHVIQVLFRFRIMKEELRCVVDEIKSKTKQASESSCWELLLLP